MMVDILHALGELSHAGALIAVIAATVVSP